MLRLKGDRQIDYSNLSDKQKRDLISGIDNIPGEGQGGHLRDCHKTTQKELDSRRLARDRMNDPVYPKYNVIPSFPLNRQTRGKI